LLTQLPFVGASNSAQPIRPPNRFLRTISRTSQFQVRLVKKILKTP